MKRIFLLVLTILSLSSCYKDELSSSVYDQPGNPTAGPYTIDLIADSWNKIAAGVYVCSFKNIIPPVYRNNRGMKVYLLHSAEKVLLDHPIHFMSGELSATTTVSDVTINYRCYAVLPFERLNIVVEIR